MYYILAAKASDESRWSGLLHFVQKVGDFILALAPALIVLSFAIAALLWVSAGSSTKMATYARDQFKATCVATVILGGYFVVKGIISMFAIGGFG